MSKFTVEEWVEVLQALNAREKLLKELSKKTPDDLYWFACFRDTLSARKKMDTLDLERK